MNLSETALAREFLYRFFSLALTEPWGREWPALVSEENLALAIGSGEVVDARGEHALGSALDQLVSELRQPPESLDDEYQRVFGLTPARECPPFETEYHGNAETFYCSQQLADIAGFYRAFGLNPGAMATVRPDHLTLELEFMAYLLMKQRLLLESNDHDPSEKIGVVAKAEADFYRDHLAWWVPAFARGLAKRSVGGYYSALSRALGAFIVCESHRFGVRETRTPLVVVPTETRDDATECAGCTSN
jgi:TorA maturation chaperone TorD